MQSESLKRWVVVLSGSLLFFYSFMQLNIINPISSLLMKDFSLDATQLGNLSAMYFYVNCILLIPAGLLLDRVSIRKSIIFSMCFSITGVFIFAFSHNVFVAGFGRMLTGVGGAFCFLSCMCLAARWFPPRQMALIAGCLITMCMLGGLMAQTPMTFMVKAYGWHRAMMADGYLGIFCLLIIWLFVQDHPPRCEEEETTTEHKKLKFWQSFRSVLFNRHNWLGGLYTAFMNLPIFLLGALWGSMYLIQVQKMSAATASYVMTTLFVGTIVGSPIVGWLSDRLGRRRLLMAICAVLAFFVMLAIIYLPHPTFWSQMTLFFLLGFMASAQALSYPLVTQLNSPAVTGLANSIVSVVLIASGFIFQPFFGWLMELHNKPAFLHRIAVYSPQDFHFGMMIMPAAFILSFIVALLIKEVVVKSAKST